MGVEKQRRMSEEGSVSCTHKASALAVTIMSHGASMRKSMAGADRAVNNIRQINNRTSVTATLSYEKTPGGHASIKWHGIKHAIKAGVVTVFTVKENAAAEGDIIKAKYHRISTRLETKTSATAYAAGVAAGAYWWREQQQANK